MKKVYGDFAIGQLCIAGCSQSTLETTAKTNMEASASEAISPWKVLGRI